MSRVEFSVSSSLIAVISMWVTLASCASAEQRSADEIPNSVLSIGQIVEPAVYAAWEMEIPPSGAGLPVGAGDAVSGEMIFQRRCAGCHTFGKNNTRGIPVLAGGIGTLATDSPLLTVGSYWPFATSLFSYIRKAMPFPEPGSLSDSEVYSLVAYILAQNDLWPPDGTGIEEPMDRLRLLEIKMPNRDGFSAPDPRPDTHNIACLSNCIPLVDLPAKGAGTPHEAVAPSVASIPLPVPRTERRIQREATELPFGLELAHLPMGQLRQGLHSFSSAVVPSEYNHAGAWLIVGGRTNGLHRSGVRGSPSGASFPFGGHNNRLYAIDPRTGEVASVGLGALPELLQDSLSTNNAVATQVGDVLWVMGGYGWNSQTREYGTFGLLTAIKVSALVSRIFEQDEAGIRDLFSQGKTQNGVDFFGSSTKEGDFRFNVTGGGLETIGDRQDLVVVLGQRFGGEYTQTGGDSGPVFQQFYTCRVLRMPRPVPVWGSRFTVSDNNITIVAEGGDNCEPGHSGNPNDPYHRRDLNVEPIVYREGPGAEDLEGIGIYGGVFSQNMGGFTQPIYISEHGALLADDATQTLSQYEAASFGLYDTETGTMHTTILGGMGVNYCTAHDGDPDTAQCTEVVYVQPPAFTGDGTILSWQYAQRQFSEVLLYKPYLHESGQLAVGDIQIDGGLLGTNARFFYDPDVSRYENGVIKLRELAAGKRVRVGYVFGGVTTDGEAPRNVFFNSGPSASSHLVFEVWVTAPKSRMSDGDS